MTPIYTPTDSQRVIEIREMDYRSPFRRDYARLIHSPSFRRLQGKTQLYPGVESDFFRNRLTHSLEVAQIAKTIALKLNYSDLKDHKLAINPDICEFAGLAHDLGHPPFGHQGEEALDACMRDQGGFEGNAQTLRILSKLEKKKEGSSISEVPQDEKAGLNLTYRSLASILKYDRVIPQKEQDRESEFKLKPVKGYYASDQDLVLDIKDHVVGDKTFKDFKTVECHIMDIADDIAYSTYDLEDGLKAGFYHPTSFLTYSHEVYERIAKKVSKSIEDSFTAQQVKDTLHEIFEVVYEDQPLDSDIWQEVSVKGSDIEYLAIEKQIIQRALGNIINYTNSLSLKTANDGALRGELTSKLVNRAIEGIKINFNKEFPSQSIVYLEPNIKIGVEVLKNFTYESQIQSPRLKVAEYRGKQIVTDIFKALSSDDGWMLLPEDFQTIYLNTTSKHRCICDFIAGMTDKYAIEFYGRLKSERPETIFKPF